MLFGRCVKNPLKVIRVGKQKKKLLFNSKRARCYFCIACQKSVLFKVLHELKHIHISAMVLVHQSFCYSTVTLEADAFRDISLTPLSLTNLFFLFP